MTRFTQASEIIQQLGGTRRAARSIGVSEQNVSNWKRKKAIPPKYLRIVIELLQASGHSATLDAFTILKPKQGGNSETRHTTSNSGNNSNSNSVPSQRTSPTPSPSQATSCRNRSA